MSLRSVRQLFHHDLGFKCFWACCRSLLLKAHKNNHNNFANKHLERRSNGKTTCCVGWHVLQALAAYLLPQDAADCTRNSSQLLPKTHWGKLLLPLHIWKKTYRYKNISLLSTYGSAFLRLFRKNSFLKKLSFQAYSTLWLLFGIISDFFQISIKLSLL